MTWRLFVVKGAKPAAVAVTGYGTYYAYQEWNKIGAALKIDTLLTSRNNTKTIEDIFDGVDLDRNGKLSCTELQLALSQAGMDLSILKLKAMIYAVDTNYDGKIDKTEFKTLVEKILSDRTLEENQLLNITKNAELLSEHHDHYDENYTNEFKRAVTKIMQETPENNNNTTTTTPTPPTTTTVVDQED